MKERKERCKQIGMAVMSRNFRSHYYDKVGLHGVEEKKSLELLLNEKSLDKTKISKFCLMFTVPSIYREHVWKLLLGVIPVHRESYDGVLYQREELVKELKHSLKIMQKVDENAPKPVMLTYMYLLGQGMILFETEKQMNGPEGQHLISIATVFADVGSNEVSQFWLFRNFMLFQKKNRLTFRTLEGQFGTLLKKEDPELYNHLINIKALKLLPVIEWFRYYFSNVLHHRALEKLWDKIIGGSCKILLYVGIAMLMMVRRDLLSYQNPEMVLKRVEKVSESSSDIIVAKALDLCPSVL